MYQKDYILRMIEMLGELLRALFGMIGKKQFDKAEETIHEAYLSMLRKDSAFFQQIPAEELTTRLIEDHNYTGQHLEILAGLLYAEASVQFFRGKQTESLPFYRKSLLLYEFLNNTDKTYSEERLERMDEIRSKLNEADLKQGTR